MTVEHRVGAAAAVTNDVLEGVLTERDSMVKVTDRDADPMRLLVEDARETDMRAVTRDVSHGQAATFVLAHHCRHLPVANARGRILGMLSIRHPFPDQLRRLRGQMDSLESCMAEDRPGGQPASSVPAARHASRPSLSAADPAPMSLQRSSTRASHVAFP